MTRKETIAEGVTLYLGDCREILPTLARHDASVTDPPYGINAARDRKSQKNGWRDYDAPGWDLERPPADLIKQILGASKHSIIWGGNYFTDTLPPSGKWLSWDKGQTDFSLADFELAWCSFDGAARRILLSRSVAMQDGKEHPTQKPLEVMRWCLQRLPKGCRTILDPFMGSGTTGVAAVNMGFQFTGIEKVTKFFDVSCRRIQVAINTPSLFVEPPKPAKQEVFEL
jgi:DNA modification methylase